MFKLEEEWMVDSFFMNWIVVAVAIIKSKSATTLKAIGGGLESCQNYLAMKFRKKCDPTSEEVDEKLYEWRHLEDNIQMSGWNGVASWWIKAKNASYWGSVGWICGEEDIAVEEKTGKEEGAWDNGGKNDKLIY